MTELSTEDPKVEELKDSDDEDEAPELVNPTSNVEEEKGASRGEKKARKAIGKLGLKQVEGVERVTMKKSKNVLFVVPNADVFKSPSNDTYIIFGEAKVEDLAAKAAAVAAQQANAARAEVTSKVPETYTQPVVDDEVVDESGVDPKDIELVVSQAGCSRSAAVKALKNNENDIVNAIMELTM
mmetsp:Transcript_24652/g.22405  ORF Transcript_24652/g.22405 Transcript_24652/m.22405 type:complete len:183 (-) Transcript_24652:34-582(-)|eukprot:CAMPEP_0196767268 /NCGR_PEP_ID=MMETSP1095-20130614/38215_1 /TAXON_ID=96789 ORGANISM="Chromulina nebulosa, Strain UTEXLB2642" /NCGR_SAMPLE_ID=MMETSP1095 /ASSEMBLY_ACC=CAM_ASM_000446 /LENGTH=182 /DNA_ID=CAMNT_0042134389 /DNA_START=34 /DNA_END=582 /DNA_ORIENTATION=-